MAFLEPPLLSRYRRKLAALPPSGGGGCHPALLGVASLGVMAGVPADDIFRDLRQRVHGTRCVPDREIQVAVEKAAREIEPLTAGRMPVPRAKGSLPHPKVRPPVKPPFQGDAALRRLIEAGRGHGETAVMGQSPIRIDWSPEEDAWRVLEALYAPDEMLYIGPPRGQVNVGIEIREARQWIERFQKLGPAATGPHVIPNPLSGLPAPTADGTGMTLRGDACVARFRFAVVEFDGLSREDQLAFWWSARLPVAVLVDSGGKSVHGWVRVRDVDRAEDWTRVVEAHLFGNFLKPLGVDGACRNESRLSRLPGHRRRETGNWQRLLYLAPQGKAVAA